ncbi:hypothetical protein CDG76_09070 [Nostoc sp. 'Peltigera membranacea cyanobiont' 210A]|nr:hypothetical protein CDG76_09070 [Nostoc sp. 'Peltigera membranacea cyanobiont' 210A]
MSDEGSLTILQVPLSQRSQKDKTYQFIVFLQPLQLNPPNSFKDLQAPFSLSKLLYPLTL